MPHTSPEPPEWFMLGANVISIFSCAILILYLMNKLECNKYVRMMLAGQAGFVLLALIAYSER